MTELARLARPYAKAAFEYAQSHAQLPQWADMLAVMARYMEQPEVMQFLKDPRFNTEQHMQLGLDLGERVLDEAGVNFIKTLAMHQRLVLLPTIFILFEHLRAVAEKTLLVTVKSVTPLSQEESKHLRQQLNKKFSADVILQYEIDPELGGGLFIQAGDYVIDASVKGQLQRMQQKLFSN